MAGRAADVRAISFSAFPEIFTRLDPSVPAILVSSNPFLPGRVVLVSFSLCCSDHKPVSAGFQIRSVAPPKLLKPKMAHVRAEVAGACVCASLCSLPPPPPPPPPPFCCSS